MIDLKDNSGNVIFTGTTDDSEKFLCQYRKTTAHKVGVFRFALSRLFIQIKRIIWPV